MNNIKIYYEDTDASGRVYHANYLKYLERGRTNFLHKKNITHDLLLKKFKIFFVVKKCFIDFKKPAYFEDLLNVKTKIKEFNKIKIIFKQSITRSSEYLLDAEILVVTLNKNGKIEKMPDILQKNFY
tara:strand:- start:434 stop:814 length:381 start_codon:yes stop_codon:yes gene_type:complete